MRHMNRSIGKGRVMRLSVKACLTAMGLMAVLATATVHADSLLSVAPLRVLLSDGKTSEVLSLLNRSEQVRTYKVKMQDQVMGEDGNLKGVDDFAYSAKRMLRFMPRQVTLQPGQRQTVRVMATPPEGLEDGEYHTHLVFDEVLKDTTEEVRAAAKSGAGLKVQMETTYSVGLPLIYQHGKVTGTLAPKAAKLVTLPNGKTVFDVTLARTGNGEGTGVVDVVAAGKEGESLVPKRQMHMYREVDQVTLRMPLRDGLDVSVQALQGMKLQARVQEEGQPALTVGVE